jgi:hypothetical protein
VKSIYSLNPKKKITLSKKALKNIYDFIASLTVVELLSQIFTLNGNIKFKGSQVLLGVVFFCTVIRLIHGHSIHLEMTYGTRFKLTFDFLYMLAQIVFLYFMAISVTIPSAFMNNILTLTVIDGIWLITLYIYIRSHRGFLKKLQLRKEMTLEFRWFGLDLIMYVFYALVVRFKIYDLEHFQFILMIIVLITTCADYLINNGFYLPKLNTYEIKEEGFEIKIEREKKKDKDDYTIKLNPRINWKVTENKQENQEQIFIKIGKLQGD